MTDTDARLARLIRPTLRTLKAYHVPVFTGPVKIDNMENPYALPADMRAQMAQALTATAINRYPDPQAPRLKELLRTQLEIPSALEIMLGNGSDELIQILCMAVAAPGRVVLAPDPSFSMYRLIATITGMEFVGVPLTPDFELDMPALRAAIAEHQPAVIFLCHPNNPTGNLWPDAQLREIVALAPGLVVVDEAYSAFAETSFLPEVTHHEHLLVLRTLSKMGLAGLRLGLLLGHSAWLHELDKIRLPFNVNILTQTCAEFALQHYSVLEDQAARLRADRERLLQALALLPGVTVFPSKTNFILFRVPPGRASPLFDTLKAQGILIKNLTAAHPLLTDCLRVTVGTPEECAAFIHAIEALI